MLSICDAHIGARSLGTQHARMWWVRDRAAGAKGQYRVGIAESPSRSLRDPLHQMTAPIQRWDATTCTAAHDELALEEPLDVRILASSTAHPDQATPTPGTIAAIAKTLAVIMRTPGHDEELAAGFLHGEGLLLGRDEVATLRHGDDADGLPSDNVLDLLPAPGVDLLARAEAGGYSRLFAVNASCGVCGKNSVAAACTSLPPLPIDGFSIAPTLLYGLPDRLRAEQRIFAATGGLHAAGLFDAEGHLLALREDIGRHNAVDKLIGRALLDSMLPLRQHILLVSGRLSFEIVLKALAARIPVLAAVSAPSSLAVDLAAAGGITLAAFLRGTHVNIYTHPQRIQQP